MCSRIYGGQREWRKRRRGARDRTPKRFRLNLVGARWDAEQVKNRPAGIDLLYGCEVGLDGGF